MCGTNMAITSMVFSSSEHVYPQSTFIATSERSTSVHIRKKSKTGGLVGFRKSLASKDISDKAAKLIFNLFLRIGLASVGLLVW